MVKFSDFIRSPGTAGPPTQQGIYALGFALRDEIIELLGKFVRVDAAQSFSAGEKTQGRANIDAQEASASLTSLAGLTTAADQLAYTTAPDTWAVTTLTPFARTILEDANAAAARTTLGLGNVDNTSDADKPVSTAQQAALNLKANIADLQWLGKAVGEFYWADDGVAGVEIPPSGSAGTTVWIELTSGLTGAGQFNAGKLASESVSGSAPLVLATAVVSFAGSPMNGQTIRLLNTERRMLRAGSPGTLQFDAIQNVTGTISGGQEVLTGTGPFTTGAAGASNRPNNGTAATQGLNFDLSLVARTDVESRTKNIGVRVFRRIK